MKFGAIIAGILFAVAVLILLKTGDDRPRCNAVGDVRYIGERKYVCEESVGNGLRWTWKMF